MLATTLLLGTIMPIQTILLRNIIDLGMSYKFTVRFALILALYVFVFLVMLLQNYIQDTSKMLLQKKLSENFEFDILKHLNSIEYWCFEDPKTHDVINRFSSPASIAADTFYSIVSLPQQLISLFGMAILFYNTSPLFSLLVAVLFCVSLFFNLIEIKKLRSIQLEQSVAERKTNYIANLFADRIAAKETRFFGLKEHLLKLFRTNTSEMLRERNMVKRKGFIGGVLSQILNVGLTVLGVIMLLTLGIKSKVTVSEVISLSTALPALGLMASFYLPNIIVAIKQKKYVWEDYDLLMGLPKKTEGRSDVLPHNLVIRFNDVKFSYPGTGKEILKGISFSIASGESVAIVGENGCGKSTIIKLMLGLYSNYTGGIYVGETSIHELSNRVRKNLFAALFQDSKIYQLSIKDNILLSDENSENNIAFNELVHKFDLLNFVDKFPELYDTKIGEMYTNGINLSGGQLQRLALARVIMSSSKFVILDEPTASMDPKAESALYEELIPLFKDRSIIIVSHRLATAKMADRILVIKNGTIVESGSHAELMKKNGYYYNMFSAQAAWYRRGDEKSNEK
ncbi:MAG: ABC transporter ATP-binding protein [Eubacteriales bacterium]